MSASTGWEDVYRVQTARITQLEAEIAALKAGEHLLFSQRLVPKLEAENNLLKVQLDEARLVIMSLQRALDYLTGDDESEKEEPQP